MTEPVLNMEKYILIITKSKQICIRKDTSSP